MAATRNKRLGYRIRAAAILGLRAARRPMTVAELVRVMDEWGLPLGAYPAKTVADAVRWEVKRGRILRVRRGTYAAGRVKRSTADSMRYRVVQYADQLRRANAAVDAEALAAISSLTGELTGELATEAAPGTATPHGDVPPPSAAP